MANKFLVSLIVLLGCIAAASAWCQQNYKYETNMVVSTLKGRGCYKTFLSLAQTSGKLLGRMHPKRSRVNHYVALCEWSLSAIVFVTNSTG